MLSLLRGSSILAAATAAITGATVLACGSDVETSSVASGAGGSTTSVTATSGSSSATGQGGAGGAGGSPCGQGQGAADCVCNGHYESQVCVEGTWQCPECEPEPCVVGGESTCPEGWFCSGAGSCGEGVCAEKPVGECPPEYAPVCGCDGALHGSACGANSAGVTVDEAATCPGAVKCGPLACDQAVEYCLHGVSDVGGEPDTWACLPAPAACAGAPECGCLAEEPCASWCELDDDGGVTLTCPGG